MMPGATWDGILTRQDHVPSTGEWQRLISQSSLFTYWSMTCLLHKFPQALISDLSIFSKCRAMIIFDRMNSLKTLIDRDVLTSRHFTPDDQPMKQLYMFSLTGVASITINHWSIRPEENMEQLKGLMQGTLGDSLYVGASLRRHWTNKDKTARAEENKDDPEKQAAYARETRAIYRHNIVTFGVPIIRVV